MSDDARTRVIVVHPVFSRDKVGADGGQARLEEAIGLAEALDLDVRSASLETIKAPRPATLFGEGKVHELAATVADEEAELLIVDGTLTPVQQRNLERDLSAKVLDRTALILEIFGERAKTAEGVLQVELAHLTYQKSRLVRSWTHLERQRGGLGFVGGPGETQIEADRRMIGDRIARIEKKLEKVVRTRDLHRQKRRRGPVPVVALVGYTNAGKSSLFNRITGSGVLAKDMLFATLDPTMRAIELDDGTRAILSDTVGFVSNLPTQLVAAFRATLEEVLEADLIVHVRDVSNDESQAQARDVDAVLRDLGVCDERIDGAVQAFNKIDLLDGDAQAAWRTLAARNDEYVCTSAATGAGVDDLLGAITARLSANSLDVQIAVPVADGAALAWLHESGDVRDTDAGEEQITLQVRLSPANAARFTKRFGYPIVV